MGLPFSRSRRSRQFAVALAGLLLVVTSAVPVAAQFLGQRINVVDALASRIHANADLTRSVGQYRRDSAQALLITTMAYKQDIINSVERKNAKWERLTIEEAERMKRTLSFLQKTRQSKSRYWERLEENIDRSAQSIVDGEGLNFLLDRLSGTFYSHQFAQPGSSPPDSWAGVDELRMDAKLLASLRVKQDLSGGQRLVFRPNDGMALGVDVWPVMLRAKEFDLDRAAFVAAREQAVDDAADAGLQRVSTETFAELRATLDRMTERFEKSATKAVRTESIDTHKEYHAAKDFLKSLDGELRQLEKLDTKSNRAFNGDFRFAGDNRPLGEFVQYMARAGLRFAPAEPGDEPDYHRLFRMMRDLYRAVGKDDTYIVGWEDLSGNMSLAKRVAEANKWRERARHERNEPEYNGRERELENKLEVETKLKDK